MTETKNEALNEVKPVGNINRDPRINNKKNKNISFQGTNHVQKEVPFLRKL